MHDMTRYNAIVKELAEAKRKHFDLNTEPMYIVRTFYEKQHRLAWDIQALESEKRKIEQELADHGNL
jgi:hypothetical protein